MLFVFLSHFAAYAPQENRNTLQLLSTVAMIASPTFMIMSGGMLGLLFATAGSRFPGTRVRLIDRSLFLMSAGHLFIMGAFVFPTAELPQSLERTFITDAIGFSLIISALIIPYTTPSRRLLMAGACYVASVLAIFHWTPNAGSGASVKDVLIGWNEPLPGTSNPRILTNTFPLLPWLSVMLAASTAGEWVGRMLEVGNIRVVTRRWILVGLAGLLSAVVLKAAYLIIRPDEMSTFRWDLYMLTSPFAKRPPLPAYLLFFGGSGVLLTGILFAYAHRPGIRRVVSALAVIGRASLFTFIVQFYVYRYLSPAVPGGYGPAWPVTFAATVALLWGGALWWDQHVGNSAFTIGFAALHRRWVRRSDKREGYQLPDEVHLSRHD